MNGIDSAIGAEGAVRRVLGRGNSQPYVDRSGALTSAKRAVSHTLASVGFVDIAGGMREHLEVFLNRAPVEIAAKDFNSQFIAQLVSWVAAKVAERSNEATQAQAHIRPETAVTLLT